MLKVAAVPPFPTAAQKLAQQETTIGGSPTKSPSTPVLRSAPTANGGAMETREGSRERLNKYAAAGSPAIYQQERQKTADGQRQSASPQKYALNEANSGIGNGGKESGRRNSRDGGDLLGGSNLISHFKNLVNVSFS